jgi:hypothetical protein
MSPMVEHTGDKSTVPRQSDRDADVIDFADLRQLKAWRKAVDHLTAYGFDVVWALPEHVRKAGTRRGCWQ